MSVCIISCKCYLLLLIGVVHVDPFVSQGNSILRFYLILCIIVYICSVHLIFSVNHLLYFSIHIMLCVVGIFVDHLRSGRVYNSGCVRKL